MADEAVGEQEFPQADRTAAGSESPEVPKPEMPADPSEGLPDPRRVGRVQFVVDVVERALWTYVQTFIGMVVLADKLSIEYATAAAFSALPAGLSVLKAGLARFLGDKHSAAAVPRRVQNWAAGRSGSPAGSPVLPSGGVSAG